MLARMTHPLDLPSLTPGTAVHDTLLVMAVERRSYDGGAYTVITLGNATGRIDSAPFWERDRNLVDAVHTGQVVRVAGEVDAYRGARQVRVTALEVLPPGSVDPARLLPTVGDVTPYWDAVDGWRREIAKPRLARVLSLFYDDGDFRRRYEACPGSVVDGGHHAAVGGLLQHTVEVGTIARTIARACGADRDLVIAGVLLHDIGKLEAYSWEGLFGYTAAHHLTGHVVLGALMLERRLAAIPEPPCTEHEQAILRHLILSHHGRLEFGSPVVPLTLEAEVLHWADNASAKTAHLARALQEAAAFDGDGAVSRRRFWQLDHRRVYRGASDWGATT